MITLCYFIECKRFYILKGVILLHKKFTVFIVVLLLIFVSALPVFAHGGEEEGAVDVPTLVRQSIAFIEGINDMEMAKDKLNEAIEVNQETQLADGQKLEQAKLAMDEMKMEEAKTLMVEAIGGNPENDLEYEPKVSFGAGSIFFMILAIISVILGAFILKKQHANKGEMSHE